MGYLWFRVRVWYRETRTALQWKLAYALPRAVALLAFVRVYAVLGECDENYALAYNAFAAGKGR